MEVDPEFSDEECCSRRRIGPSSAGPGAFRIFPSRSFQVDTTASNDGLSNDQRSHAAAVPDDGDGPRPVIIASIRNEREGERFFS